MKSFYKIIIISMLLTFTFSCKFDFDEDTAVNQFSISLGEFKDLKEARSFKAGLEKTFKDGLIIQKVNDNHYRVLLNEYPNAFEAGKTAFGLMENQIIKKFKIIHQKQVIEDNYNNILLIGKYLGRNSIYSFNLQTKNRTLLWSKSLNSVLLLNRSEDRTLHYFVTGRKVGLRDKMPYIEDAKLWLYKEETEEPEIISEFDECIQLYTYWEGVDSFKVNITKIDTLKAYVVNQSIFNYYSKNRQRSQTQRSFDLIQQGFPVKPRNSFVKLSPNNQYQLDYSQKGEWTELMIRDYNERSVTSLPRTGLSITESKWSDDGNYIFVIFEDAASTEPKNIYNEIWIIDAQKKSLVNKLSGEGLQNLLLHGKLLFFDEQIGTGKRIRVYDYIKNQNYYTIEIAGGASISKLDY